MKNIQSLINKQIFKISILKTLCFLVLPVYSNPASQNRCEGSFIAKTRYEAQLAASRVNYNDFHSNYLDFKRDQELESKWNFQNKDVPSLLQILVPEGVFPVNHREAYSARPYLVRLQAWGASIRARAHYTHNGIPIATNILFGVHSIKDRIKNWNRKWLISPRAKAAVLFLHGGGTRTAGSVAYASKLTHLVKYGIEGVAMDLPMHSEGSRKIFGSIQEEVLSIGSFAKKYIPENVPLFVYGHSFGAVFTDEIMRMTGQHDGNTDFFHPSLKGVVTASPPVVDSAPGKSLEEKVKSYIDSQDLARRLEDTLHVGEEEKIWADVIAKVSPLGGLFLSIISMQMNQFVPKDEQSDLIRTLMMVGKHDPLVYLGVQDLFHKYFDHLPNVETQYFDQKPDWLTGSLTKVQHLLGKYRYSNNVNAMLDIESLVRFIAEGLDTTPDSLLKQMGPSYLHSAGGDSLVYILQHYFNDLSIRYWLKHFVGSQIKKDSDYMEKLLGAQHYDYTEALKLYEQYLPENQLISLLKKIVLAPSMKDVQALQKELKTLRSNHAFSSFSPSSLLMDLEKAKDIAEAEQVSKEILRQYFPEDFKYKSTMDIMNSIRGHKGLPQAFDVFPFDQGVSVPEHSIFFLPPVVRNHILDILSKYGNEEEPRWVSDKIVQEIRNNLREYEPSVVLFNTLNHFSPESKELKKSYLPTLKSYKNQLPQGHNYKEINKDLEVLIKEQSISKMIEHAVLMIKKYSVSPVTSGSYFMAKLKLRINNPNIPMQEVTDALRPFQLPKEIQDQIINMLKDSREGSYPAVVDLIIEHTPLNVIYNLMQVLRKMTSFSTLREFIKDFPNYSLFNQNERDSYFNGLENHQILQKVLSGDISAKEIWNRKYYLLKGSAAASGYSKKNPLRQPFKGKGDISQILKSDGIPEDIAAKIMDHYNNNMRIGRFIKGSHVPSLHHFSRNLHDGNELTKEQVKEYSDRIDKIRKIVEVVAQLENEERGLYKEKRQLEIVVNNLNDSINHDISLIHTAFKNSFVNPPASMAQKYHTVHQEYYIPLEKVTYKLADMTDASVVPLLTEQRNLTFEQMQEKFHQSLLDKDIQSIIKDREFLVDAWKTKRRELTREWIRIVIEGEMGMELQQSAINLYGNLPRFDFGTNEDTHYFVLQANSHRLAEVEANIFKTREQIIKLSVEYDHLYPNSVLSVVEPIHPMEILNFDSSHSSLAPEYIRDNNKAFDGLWKIIKNLRAALPPPLPDLE